MKEKYTFNHIHTKKFLQEAIEHMDNGGSAVFCNFCPRGIREDGCFFCRRQYIRYHEHLAFHMLFRLTEGAENDE